MKVKYRKLGNLAREHDLSLQFLKAEVEAGRLKAKHVSERVTLVHADEWNRYIGEASRCA